MKLIKMNLIPRIISCKHVYILILLYLFFASCNNLQANVKEEKFRWSASVTSAKGYPIEVHVGYLATKDTFITSLPKGSVEDQGWAADGQDAGSGGNIIPENFSLTWVSYAEKKFWKVEDSLPKEKILALFKKGFYNTDRVTRLPKHETYENIAIAVAPGGVVVVLLTGTFHRVEIGRYQAKDVIVGVNEFYDNPDGDTQQQFYDWWYNHSLTDSLKELIKHKGIPYGLWDKYRDQYNYRFRVQFYKVDKEESLEITYLNGEETIMDGEDLNSFDPKPLPWRANLIFSERWAETEFDEEEIMAAFKTLSKEDKNAQIKIVGKVGFMYNSMEFWVQCNEKKIVLNKVKVSMWNTIKKGDG